MNHKEKCCCKEENKHTEECKEKHSKEEDCECHCNDKGPCH